MEQQQITNNEKLSEILPMLRQQFDFINSPVSKEYEEKLSKVTGESLSELERIISDGTLALDPEQLVNAVKVLTAAKKDITESKRKLLETLLRGEIMMKAIDTPKNQKDDGKTNALIDYMKRQNLDKPQTTSTSIFEQVNQLSDEDA